MDFAELAASLLDWQQFQAVENEWDIWVERVFDRLDSDQNGYVDLAEIMACGPLRVCRCVAAQIATVFDISLLGTAVSKFALSISAMYSSSVPRS